MRARNLKPGFFKNFELAQIVRPWGRILFEGLWGLADREGKLYDRPEWIRAEVFPYDSEFLPLPIDEILNLLQGAAEPFIIRYEVEGRKYIQILNFLRHQSPHCKEAPSTIPAPEKHKNSTRKAPCKPKTKTSAAPPDSLTPDSLNPSSLTPIIKPFVATPDGERLASFLLEKILDRKPDFKKPNLIKWATEIDRIIQADARDPTEIEKVILWCQEDSFWQDNILSPGKLRKQYDQLTLKMKKSKRKGTIEEWMQESEEQSDS